LEASPFQLLTQLMKLLALFTVYHCIYRNGMMQRSKQRSVIQLLWS